MFAHRSIGLVLALFACCALTSCGKGKAEGGEGASASASTHECSVTVAEKTKGEPEKFKGSAQGPDEKAAEEEAWKNACDQLPEAERDSCRDSEKFTWAASGMSVDKDGAKEYSKNITLTRVVKPKEFEGKGTSSENGARACEQALAEACKAAGADGDCVAAGTHDKRGEMASSTTVGSKKK